jgi:hypothetical protein
MAVPRSNPAHPPPNRPHEVFAVMNNLRNPRLAEIYLSLVAADGDREEIARARRLVLKIRAGKVRNNTGPGHSDGSR